MKKIITLMALAVFIFSSCKKAVPEAAKPDSPVVSTTPVPGTPTTPPGTPTTPPGTPGPSLPAFSANFTYKAPDMNNIFERQIIHFESKASGVVSYVWQFGNNVKSFSQNPDISYAMHGYYPVTLIVVDKDGNTATSTQNISILCTLMGDHPSQ